MRSPALQRLSETLHRGTQNGIGRIEPAAPSLSRYGGLHITQLNTQIPPQSAYIYLSKVESFELSVKYPPHAVKKINISEIV